MVHVLLICLPGLVTKMNQAVNVGNYVTCTGSLHVPIGHTGMNFN